MDATVAQDDSVYKEDSGDTSEETASADDSLEAGLALIEGSDCRTCHQNDTRVIGPSYKEVAEKYSEEDIDVLVSHIIDGSVGIWGRSEERRVGREWRCGRAASHDYGERI